MDITGRLKRISAGTYKDNRDDIWRLVPVDREYSCNSKPIYYLQKIKNSKAQYVSGVFQTMKENVFSADIKDSLGVKKYYEIQALNNGEELVISLSKTKVK